jgi:predicted ATP-grasp superfamily ATP-dependent carboligase
MRVLVLDGDNRAALAVTRSLGRNGHFVAVGAPRATALAQTSRFCAARARYVDPSTDPDGFIDSLEGEIRRLRIDVLLPISDISTLLVTEHRQRLAALCQLPLASNETIALAADKASILQTAERLGIPIPRTVFVDGPEPSAEALAGLTWPVVMKARRSRMRTASGWVASSVAYAADRDELVGLLRALPAEAFPAILQERIEGPGMGVFMCYQRGRAVAVFGHRRLREKPPTGGVSVLSESIAIPDDARAHASRLLEELQWQGVAMVEFKVDNRDGVPKLMEVNGRFWGSLQLAIDAGVDFPNILLATLADAPVPPAPPYRTGVLNRWFWGDLDSLLLQLRARQSSDESWRDKAKAVGRFLRLWQRDLHYENPKLSDLRPWLFETSQWMRQATGLARR